jgi:hypothetical protein
MVDSMAKDDVLKRIYSDIEAGDLGKARDRLHGLLYTYPNDLHIRELLGDVYWRLQFPAMAGRYWYLTEVKGEHVETAKTAFEKSVGKDPTRIMEALKFCGDLNSLSEQVLNQIEALQQEHIKKHGYRFNWARTVEKPKVTPKAVILVRNGFLLILTILVIFFTVLGIVWLVQNLF